MTNDGKGISATAPTGISYRAAGVDIDAANGAVSRIAERAKATLGDSGAPIGHFGGQFRLPAGPDRTLVASADGVGTKLKLAFVLGGGAHARVGADLVNHCVNDLLALGARPLFFLDYVAMGRLDPDALDRLVGGMVDACRENGLALIGGETAEMPGLYADGEYDVAGFIVGEVAPTRLIDGSAVRAGDALLGLPSTGLHTNGYSLARRIVGLTGDAEHDRARLATSLPGGDGETFGEALMRPHVSYRAAVAPLLDLSGADGAPLIRGLAHITGGGLVENVPRMLPDGLAATIDPVTWPVLPVFDALCAAGRVAPAERYRAFNMGIGMVLAVAPDDVPVALARLRGAVVVGWVEPGDGGSRLVIQGIPQGAGTERGG
jgi:phosphoribosylformylglycinamidine cyclo-ligase